MAWHTFSQCALIRDGLVTSEAGCPRLSPTDLWQSHREPQRGASGYHAKRLWQAPSGHICEGVAHCFPTGDSLWLEQGGRQRWGANWLHCPKTCPHALGKQLSLAQLPFVLIILVFSLFDFPICCIGRPPVFPPHLPSTIFHTEQRYILYNSTVL